MAQVYVAGGSNIAAERNIVLAAQALRQDFPGAWFSSCYANAALGFEGEEFVNFVVALPTQLALEAVIGRLRRIEESCGRPRNAPRWAPRAMDLDVLLYDDLVLQTAEVTLPRPDLLRRAYMLGPLAEIAPQLMHPTAGATIGALWQAFDRDAHALRRVALDLNA